MGEAARLRASQWFGIEQQVRNTEKMYLDLCGTSMRDVAERGAPAAKEEYSSLSMPNARRKWSGERSEADARAGHSYVENHAPVEGRFARNLITHHTDNQ